MQRTEQHRSGDVDEHAEFLARLEAVLQRRHAPGTRLLEARPLTGGAASSTWKLRIEDVAGTRELILRRSQGAAQIATGLDKRVEAGVQSAAAGAGVPAARIPFILEDEDGLGSGFAMEYLEGETIPQKLLRDERFASAREMLTAQCGEIAARIHAVDVSGIEGLPEQSVQSQLLEYERLHRSFGQQIATFELALRWLQRHAPAESGRTLVHGDFRNGNFIVDPARGIVAVLDWELAHRGDPMEDLGWLCVNSWRFGVRDKPVGGFGDRKALFEAYRQASGREVDPVRVHYWEVFGTLRWGIICQYMCHGHVSGAERSVERAAIGRRVSETEIDLLCLLRGEHEH